MDSLMGFDGYLHVRNLCHEDREQLFLQAEHAKGELCVTIANWGWEDIFLQWLDVSANKKDKFVQTRNT